MGGGWLKRSFKKSSLQEIIIASTRLWSKRKPFCLSSKNVSFSVWKTFKKSFCLFSLFFPELSYFKASRHESILCAVFLLSRASFFILPLFFLFEKKSKRGSCKKRKRRKKSNASHVIPVKTCELLFSFLRNQYCGNWQQISWQACNRMGSAIIMTCFVWKAGWTYWIKNIRDINHSSSG